jgi:hypothetical protein
LASSSAFRQFGAVNLDFDASREALIVGQLDIGNVRSPVDMGLFIPCEPGFEGQRGKDRIERAGVGKISLGKRGERSGGERQEKNR